MSTLRAGVIGAGVFGGHHARKYQADARVALTAIYDVESARAEILARDLGAKSFSTLDAFLSAVDVVTIASIPISHGAAAKAALSAGKHVLVEKPLAVTAPEAAELVALAARHALTLACGHQERLVFEAMGLFQTPERPTRIECVRAGPWTGRSADVSVTLDLMVHDIDLALQLMGAPPHRVAARGHAKHGRAADDVSAILSFEGGAAKLKATRIAEARERTMKLVYPSGEVTIDFIARTFENGTDFNLNKDFAETSEGRDPLGANVTRFIDAVSGKAPRPAVDGVEGEAVLNLALRVDRAADLPSLSAAESDHAPVH